MSSSPRVLMVTGAYYPELAGGSLQCRTLVLALRDRVRFSVLTTTAERSQARRSDVDGVPVYRVFVDPRARITKIMAAGRMLGLLPALVGGSDIFHFHGFTEKMVLLMAAAKSSGRRTVEKLTSLGWDDPVAIRRRPLGAVLAAAQARADRIVAMNPALRERCRRAGIADAAIVTIPNGVDIDRFSPADRDERAEIRRRLGLPAAACLVTFVGFWSAEKAPHLLFAAWREARRQSGVDAALLFIGSTDGSHPEVDPALVAGVRRQIDLDGVGSRVRFVEQTTDVASHLRASDIFVLPSSREGLSNALLEAMSTGLACVCADIPGVTDAVIESGVNGWCLPPGDAPALAAVLATLFQDERTRHAAGGRARSTVLERFAIRSVADQYFMLYQQLMADRGDAA
jgi:glycosyltransferase involved in cell wall biosynthesis